MILINPNYHPASHLSLRGASAASSSAGLPPWALWVVPVVAVLLLALRTASRKSGRSFQTDPQRMFDGPQRAEGRRRCGDRCEHKPMLLGRCSGLAEQADHIMPWSRGGVTSLGNLQYLCRRCNLSKSDHVPSAGYIWRLERRRRRYFPADAPVQVSWRFGESPAAR